MTKNNSDNNNKKKIIIEEKKIIGEKLWKSKNLIFSYLIKHNIL
jgi:hypothetical protein